MNGVFWVSARSQAPQTTLAPLLATLLERRVQARRAAPGACDFCLGNPLELPLPGYVEASNVRRPPGQGSARAQDERARRAAGRARSLPTWRGADYSADDVLMPPVRSQAWRSLGMP